MHRFVHNFKIAHGYQGGIFKTKTGYFMSDINFSTNASRHETDAIYSIAVRKFPKPISMNFRKPSALVSRVEERC